MQTVRELAGLGGADPPADLKQTLAASGGRALHAQGVNRTSGELAVSFGAQLEILPVSAHHPLSKQSSSVAYSRSSALKLHYPLFIN